MLIQKTTDAKNSAIEMKNLDQKKEKTSVDDQWNVPD